MSTDRRPLDRLFAPRSIAVVGASASPEKAGYQMLKSLAGFPGDLYPINPKADRILGFPAYPSLADAPSDIDLVILTIPAAACVGALEEAAAAGVGGAIIISGGFAEAGAADGARLQEKLSGICHDGGIRLLGPNTSGFVNPRANVRATFAPGAERLAPGGVGLVAQSGGVNLSLAFEFLRQGIGVGLAAGLGNAIDVGLPDVIDHLATDDAIKIIAIHLEGVPDGRRLFESVRAATAVKPVVALPVGRSDIGDFAKSHTGNLMGSHALTVAALRQAGAVPVRSTDDLIDAAHAFLHGRLPASGDPGVGVLTGQAGPGLIIADALKVAGVSIPSLTDKTVEKIETLLPPLTYIRNPVDTGRPGATFPEVLDAVAADPAIDLLLTYALYEPDALDIGDVLSRANSTLSQPLVFGTGGAPEAIDPVVERLEREGVACYTAPDRATRAVSAMVEDARARHRRLAGGTGRATAEVTGDLESPMDEDRAKSLLEAIGIAAPRRFVCRNRSEAQNALRAIGGRVVAKILDASIAHKTEVGGVQVGIETDAQLDTALDRLDAVPTRETRRYLVEAEAPPGLELILGGTNDPSFGATVLVGLGGTAAEAMADVAIALAPLSDTDAYAMLDRLQGKTLLDGWRGAPAVDRARIVTAVTALGDLLSANPGIREIDLNPVRVYPDGLLALDALIVPSEV